MAERFVTLDEMNEKLPFTLSKGEGGAIWMLFISDNLPPRALVFRHGVDDNNEIDTGVIEVALSDNFETLIYANVNPD